MRAVLLRRMMVLGVCALGVGALYLVPGLVAPSGRVAVPGPASEVPAARSNPQPGPDAASMAARSTVAPETTPRLRDAAPSETKDDLTAAPGPDRSPVAEAAPPARSAGPEADRTTGQQPRSNDVAVPNGPAEDAEPPQPVSNLSVRTADADQVRIGWTSVADDTVGYRVWLNGYEVSSTSETEATLDWFNDDSVQQVVVVRAVDAAGNQSRTGATLLLTRPQASPAVPTPTPSPSATGDALEPADPPAGAASGASPSPISGAGTAP